MEGSPTPPKESREPLTDQYGIRAGVIVAGVAVKLEIVLEGRISMEMPSEEESICGIASLTLNDLICSKLLANSDRWNDDGVFNRDLIDLAHLPLSQASWRRALAKAEEAYGDAIRIDRGKALERLWQRLLNLQRLAAAPSTPTPD